MTAGSLGPRHSLSRERQEEGGAKVKAYYGETVTDMVEGISAYRMWGRLGWQEVRRRYRRTVIGPLWSTLSLTILIAAMGVIYSRLWHQSLHDYLPFLSVGYIIWFLVQALVLEGGTVFSASEALIKQLKISFTLLVCSMVWRNVIIFAHNLLLYVLICIFFRLVPGRVFLLGIPGLLLICLNGVWIGLVTGTLCTRFRDLQPLIATILQVAMFATPVFFRADQLGKGGQFLAEYNPIFHMIEVLRGPLLGYAPSWSDWIWTGCMAVFGWALVFVLFARFRRRISYWL